jgi:hypothetical protein
MNSQCFGAVHRHTVSCSQTHCQLFTDTLPAVHRHTASCSQTHCQLVTDTLPAGHRHTASCSQTHCQLFTDTLPGVHRHTARCSQTPPGVHRHTASCSQTHRQLFTDTPPAVYRHTVSCSQTHCQLFTSSQQTVDRADHLVPLISTGVAVRMHRLRHNGFDYHRRSARDSKCVPECAAAVSLRQGQLEAICHNCAPASFPVHEPRAVNNDKLFSACE